MIVFGAILALVGVLLFMSAIAEMRKEFLIANLPVSTCDSVAMGLGALEGRAHTTNPATAPFSGRPCIYAETVITEQVGKSTRRIASIETPTNLASIWFDLTDASGTVTVVPAGAHMSYQTQTWQSGEFFDHAAPPTPEGKALLQSYGLHPERQRLTVIERFLPQDATTYVQGTVAARDAVPPAALPPNVVAGMHPIVYHGNGPAFVAVGTRESYDRRLKRAFRTALAIGPVLILIGTACAGWGLALQLPGDRIGGAARAGDVAGVVHAVDALPQRARGSLGVTRLMIDASRNDPASVRSDLAQGADIDACDNAGITALRYAVRTHALAAVLELLRAKPDLQSPDQNGETALFDSVRESDALITRALLDAGADRNVRNVRHERARDLARTAPMKALL